MHMHYDLSRILGELGLNISSITQSEARFLSYSSLITQTSPPFPPLLRGIIE